MDKPKITQTHKVYFARALMLGLMVIVGIITYRYVKEGKKAFETDIALLRQALFIDDIQEPNRNGGGAG